MPTSVHWSLNHLALSIAKQTCSEIWSGIWFHIFIGFPFYSKAIIDCHFSDSIANSFNHLLFSYFSRIHNSVKDFVGDSYLRQYSLIR